MAFCWLIAFLVFLTIEMITINLVSIWFAIGAIVSMGLAYFTNNVLIQMIVFIVVSLVTLLITKPLVKKFKKVDFVPTNSDRVIGKVGEVTKRITPDEYGEVKVFGTLWTDFSDDVLNVGDKVIITNIEGVKLIVKKEEK